jgi:hypothetical protein
MSTIIAFAGNRCVGSGLLAEVTFAAMNAAKADPTTTFLAFDSVTSRPVELDLRGSAAVVQPPPADPSAAEPARGRGRPRLGVTAREVTLLPRHWDWLNGQRAGASATLRRLVEEARKGDAVAGAMREGKESLYRFITAMAGDAPGYEEAVRALFASDAAKFEAESAAWPADVRAHAMTLLDAALGRLPSPLEGVIPADRMADVRRVLGTALPGREIEAAERMSWGFSGAGVFKITVRGMPYLLRLDNPTGPFSSPERQYACQAAAAEAGIAPALLHADTKARISLSRFVATDPFPTDRIAMLTALGKAARTLHATPLFPASIPYFDALDMILGGTLQSGLLPASVFEPAFSAYQRIKAGYPEPNFVSTHHDLNPSNILFVGERPIFVDWETAAQADRFVDLAGLANYFTADARDEAALVTAYFGRDPTAAETARLFLMRQVNRLFNGALLLMTVQREQPNLRVTEADMAAIPPFTAIRHEMPTLATPAGRQRLGCAFINEGAQALASDAFEAALAQAIC